jgi:hypothetical protein
MDVNKTFIITCIFTIILIMVFVKTTSFAIIFFKHALIILINTIITIMIIIIVHLRNFKPIIITRYKLVRILMNHEQRPDFVFQGKGPVHSNRRGCHFSRLVEGFVFTSSREGDY